MRRPSARDGLGRLGGDLRTGLADAAERAAARAGRSAGDFWRKAYEDNITGLSGMVAYNLLLSIVPLALVAVFVTGRVLGSGELEQSVVEDLRQVFPSAAESTLDGALQRLQDLSTHIGIAAIVASVWFGSSFWGALDTAFCQMYHVKCRSWIEQKQFALAMLAVVLLFMAATVAVPTLQSILASGAENLPFGLSTVRGVVFSISLAIGLLLLFASLCIIYWAVPNRRVPWRAVWPGAAGATVAIGVVDYAFPFYLANAPTLAQLGTTLVFILIVLLWFYALAIIILSGAIVNALRFERHDTAERALRRSEPPPGTSQVALGPRESQAPPSGSAGGPPAEVEPGSRGRS